VTLLAKISQPATAEAAIKTCEEIDKLESDADRVMRAAMSKLFREENDVRELIKLKAWRDNIWLSWQGGNIVRRVDDGAMDIDINAGVIGWDEHAVHTQRIRNYTSKPIEVEIRRSYGGHIDFKADLPGLMSFDFQTPQYTVNVKPGEKADFFNEVIMHQGRISRMNNFTIVKQAVGDPAEKQ
jgi:hypothetical protein